MAIETADRVEPTDHVVQFYAHVHELVRTVTRYVANALKAGDTVVVVATADHAAAFDSALAKVGIDLPAARANGTFVSLDADEALSRFLVDDWPNADAFAVEVGDVVRRLVSQGRVVKVFGEMVSMLWDAGHVGAAIELETMWNDLGRDVAVLAVLAYSARSIAETDDDAGSSFQRVCGCHSAVIGDVAAISTANPPVAATGTHAQQSFPGEPRALSATRRFVATTLMSWDLHHYVDDASMVVSELATNAVIHAQSGYTVDLSSDGAALRVSVRDASPVGPVLRHPAPTTTSGRGLILVTSIASRWGTELVDDGKLVWAELRP